MVDSPVPVSVTALALGPTIGSVMEDLRSGTTVSTLAKRIEVDLSEVSVPGQESCLVVNWKSSCQRWNH